MLYRTANAIILSCIVVALLCPGTCFPATKPAVQPRIEVKKTSDFFHWFARSADSQQPVDEFETGQEREKRKLPPFDSAKVIYFQVELKDWKPYSYDAAKQRLTVTAGELAILPHDETTEKLHAKDYARLGKGTPVAIARPEYDMPESRRTYDAINAFGAKIKVTRSIFTEYTFNFLNLEKFDVFNALDGRFEASLSLPPSAARRVSECFDIIVGVTLPGYEHRAFIPSFPPKPTLENPSEVTVLHDVIDANLVKVVVRDRTTGRVLREYGPTSD